ncbi:hypothetical protein LSUE1_G005539 [Lachnellula suecica]|uniref:BTB domain-containing protein n=1 Tax=Lachnellula suecica TaxID=602035 RepID=A0A8T9C7J3_9HELO|nr:hypothetical protein LSUE1_G005539 [Lachnellula suecica]
MVTNLFSRQPSRVIIIDPTGNLKIQCYTNQDTNFNDRFEGSDGTMKAGRILATFQKRAEKPLPTDNVSVIDLKQDKVDLFDLLFRAIHSVPMPDALHQGTIEQVWDVLDTCHIYGFRLNKLSPWFASWFISNGGCTKFGHSQLAKLLYPCQEFDHPQAFATITQRLVYEVPGHISDKMPKRFENTHHQFPPRILGGLNGARSSLKVTIRQEIDIIKDFLGSSCYCRKEGLFAYLEALCNTGAWPLEDVMHGKDALSLNRVLDCLLRFKYNCPQDAYGCDLCSRNFLRDTIEPGVKDAQAEFGGLCLDCINNSQASNERGGRSAVARASGKSGKWNAGCRIDHGEPTWWFSYISSKQKPQRQAQEPEDLDGSEGLNPSSKRKRASEDGEDYLDLDIEDEHANKRTRKD